MAGKKKGKNKAKKDGKNEAKKDGTNKDDDLSAKDLALKEQLEVYAVSLAQSKKEPTRRHNIEAMRQAIWNTSASRITVSEQHYKTLKAQYEKMQESELKTFMADILSVLALEMSEEGDRASLRFRLQGTVGDTDFWGHEYVRNLAGEIGNEFQERQSAGQPVDDLMDLVKQIVPLCVFYAQIEVVDLLLAVDKLDMLLEHIHEFNYGLFCSYLTSLVSDVKKPDDVLKIANQLYCKVNKFSEAMRVALKLGDAQYVKSTCSACEDPLEKQQLCFILAKQGISIELAEELIDKEEQRELLQELISNSKLSESYLTVARDLGVMEPKTPDDVYKSDLFDGRASAGASVDSGCQNLAATFVNGFVNAGFGVDKLMTVPSTETSGEGSSGGWLFENQEHGKASAVASLGLTMLWDAKGGLGRVEEYLYSNDKHVVAGALLAVGIINCGVRNKCDPAYARLHDSVNKDDVTIRIGAIMGLGLAYAGSQKEEVLNLLTPIVEDLKVGIDVAGFAAVALGLIYVGSCNEDVAVSIFLALRYRSEAELGEPLARFLCLGLGLLYLGKQGAADAMMKNAMTLNEKISKYCLVTLETCAYAGTGNVRKAKHLLQVCHQLKHGNDHQAPAVLGIALIDMADKLGRAIRSLEHFLQYGEQNIRRAVPLALGILSISNPETSIIDTLSRLTNDSDSEVAMSATVSLGLIGAGTNNARIAGMLRKLSSYYYEDPSLLFCVRIAQGLVHMGKGLLTLNPYHSDRFLLSNVALAGLITFLHASFDMKAFILGKFHYVLYFLVLAMQPRMLITLDENLKPLPVPVRVGQPVGGSGGMRLSTKLQTHPTPVILATGDRAQLDDWEYRPLSSVLEGFVILKLNPDYWNLFRLRESRTCLTM